MLHHTAGFPLANNRSVKDPDSFFCLFVGIYETMTTFRIIKFFFMMMNDVVNNSVSSGQTTETK